MLEKEQGKICFHYLVKPFFFPRRTSLKRFIVSQLALHRKEVDMINYIFCDDAYLLQINRQFLNHDTYTDIVTFELSAPGKPLLSDIYISIERVKENAGKFEVAFYEELLRVIFHGALHLAGLKDKTAEQAEQMRNQEDAWLLHYRSTWKNSV